MEFLDLIQNGMHTAIVNYVRTCKCLSVDEELALIKRGNHEEIMNYIAKHWFEVDAFEAFLERGKLNEIRFYIARNGIYQGYEENVLALGSGVADEFVGFLLRESKTESSLYTSPEEWANAEYHLVNSGYHCAIRRYISQRSLEKKAYNLLKVSGTPDDIMIYHLLWS